MLQERSESSEMLHSSCEVFNHEPSLRLENVELLKDQSGEN